MYELSNLNDYIDAVLLNNPIAVQERLHQLGILQAGSYDPDYLKQVIVHRFQAGEDFFLSEVLDVPIELQGAQANELLDYQLATGNRSAIQSLLLNHSFGASTAMDWSGLLQTPLGWRNAFQILGLIIGLLFIIFLIRKI